MKEPLVNYEYYQDIPVGFMSRFARYEPIVLSHSRMDVAKKCHRMYFFSIILGFRSKTTAPVLSWGVSYHLFREVLEKEYGFGENTPPKWDEEKAKVAFTKATLAGVNYWNIHGANINTVGTKWEFMTMPRLMESFAVAFQRWKQEKQSGRFRIIAVEQLLIAQLPDGSHTSGRIDKLVEWNGRLWGKDYKSTSINPDIYDRYINPNDQFTRYTFLEQEVVKRPVEGIIIELLYNAKHTKNKKHGPTVRTLLASRTQYEIDEWKKDEVQRRKFLDMCREEDHYPKNETQCAYCQFRSVCSKPSEQSQMAQLEANFRVEHFDNSMSDMGEK